MGFFKDLITLTVLETAHDVIKSTTDKLGAKQDAHDIENLEKLKALYDSGAISKREYEKKKKQILKRSN